MFAARTRARTALEMPKDSILRVIAIGPLPDDRRIILIEIPRLDATCLNFSQNVIEARLKKVGLRMCSPMYWIGKSRYV